MRSEHLKSNVLYAAGGYAVFIGLRSTAPVHYWGWVAW